MFSSPNRLLGVAFGTVYLLVGLAGFFVTTGIGFFETENPSLLVWLFSVNPFHNVAHLIIGALLLTAGASTTFAAKGTNGAIGAIYLVLGVVGLFIVGTPLNVLALNAADHVLHFGSAAVLLLTALGADRHRAVVHAAA